MLTLSEEAKKSMSMEEYQKWCVVKLQLILLLLSDLGEGETCLLRLKIIQQELQEMLKRNQFYEQKATVWDGQVFREIQGRLDEFCRERTMAFPQTFAAPLCTASIVAPDNGEDARKVMMEAKAEYERNHHS